MGSMGHLPDCTVLATPFEGETDRMSRGRLPAQRSGVDPSFERLSHCSWQ